MSSYFDTMGTCLRSPQAVAELVSRQYEYYLSEVGRKIRGERRLSKFRSEIMRPFGELQRQLQAREIEPEMFVQRVHDVAHDLGRMRPPMKSGPWAVARDNPWGIPY